MEWISLIGVSYSDTVAGKSHEMSNGLFVIHLLITFLEATIKTVYDKTRLLSSLEEASKALLKSGIISMGLVVAGNCKSVVNDSSAISPSYYNKCNGRNDLNNDPSLGSG